MPRGPKGERRLGEVNERAVMIARIATGEIDDAPPDDGNIVALPACGTPGRTRADSDVYSCTLLIHVPSR
ncbi:MAG: RNA-binding protein [Bradyrhizobium sp.]|nr:MAG: RNA-binding protein [Bradyrhizobium sp.]